MFLRHMVTFALLATSTTVWADTIDVNLRSSSVQVQYGLPVNEDNPEKSEYQAGAIYNSNGNLLGEIGVLFKDSNGSAAPAGTATRTTPSMFTFGAGLKGVIANTKPNRVTSLPLGAQVRFSLPSVPLFGITGQYYYAPQILTSGGADRYTESGLRLEYEVLPQTVAYVGYRRIELGYKTSPNVTFDSGYLAGVKVSF